MDHRIEAILDKNFQKVIHTGSANWCGNPTWYTGKEIPCPITGTMIPVYLWNGDSDDDWALCVRPDLDTPCSTATQEEAIDSFMCNESNGFFGSSASEVLKGLEDFRIYTSSTATA